MLHALQVFTTVVVGVMVGVEFCVAVFVNAIMNALPGDNGQLGRSHGARLLGAVMPFWYFTSLGLATVWAVVTWGEPGSALVVTAGGLLVVGWIGDSRVYWVPADREGPVARLTEDDSWAAQMVAAGLMSEAEAYADSRAHAITGWLGADAYELDPHTASFKPDRPGVAVVCSDGLWNYAESAEEMAAALPADALTRPLHSAQVLVGHALDGGGHDNVTVAVVPFDVRPQEGS